MNAPDHALRGHAVLSASSASRWLACPPSARLNEQMPDEKSVFATEGTLAHELAERCLVSGRHAHEVNGDYPHEMRDFVQVYADHVRAIEGELLVEQRLSFETWVQGGFGTCDAVVVGDRRLCVRDFKYGKGLRVFADHNAQLMLYGLAALDAYDPIYGPIDTLDLGIVQPRLDHIDIWEIKTSDLLNWAETVVKPIAALAYVGKGELAAGEHCQFCLVRHTCRTRAETNLAIARDDMGEWMPPPASMSDVELGSLYPKLNELVRWANDVEAYCLSRAEAGTRFPGLKLVEGRSVRQIDNKEEVIKLLRSDGFDDYQFLEQRLVGITALEKLLGKKLFAERLGQFCSKPAGKPTLVVATDKRLEIDPSQRAAAIAEMTDA